MKDTYYPTWISSGSKFFPSTVKSIVKVSENVSVFSDSGRETWRYMDTSMDSFYHEIANLLKSLPKFWMNEFSSTYFGFFLSIYIMC